MFPEKRRRTLKRGFGDCALFGRGLVLANCAGGLPVKPFEVEIGAYCTENAQRERDVGGGLVRRKSPLSIDGDGVLVLVDSGAVGHVFDVVAVLLFGPCRIHAGESPVCGELDGCFLQACAANVGERHVEKRRENGIVAVVHRRALVLRELRFDRGVER